MFGYHLDEQLGPCGRLRDPGALDLEQLVGGFAGNRAVREHLAAKPGDVHRRDLAAEDHRTDDRATPVYFERHHATLLRTRAGLWMPRLILTRTNLSRIILEVVNVASPNACSVKAG